MWKLLYIVCFFIGMFGIGNNIAAKSNQFDSATAMYATQLAGATYCPHDDLISWKCPHCITELNNIEVISDTTQVIMGVDGGRCVVAFRGSSDMKNWISNFKFIKTKPYANERVSVHSGLYEEYDEYKGRVMDFLAHHSCDEIFITGHSSGAAVAMFLAYDLMLDGRACTVFTFGKPRIGNAAFGQSIDESLMIHYRITHANDIVPHLPEEVLGFTHTSNEVWYPADGSDKYVICDGVEDKGCSNSCAPLRCTSTFDHIVYLGIRMGEGGCK